MWEKSNDIVWARFRVGIPPAVVESSFAIQKAKPIPLTIHSPTKKGNEKRISTYHRLPISLPFIPLLSEFRCKFWSGSHRLLELHKIVIFGSFPLRSRSKIALIFGISLMRRLNAGNSYNIHSHNAMALETSSGLIDRDGKGFAGKIFQLVGIVCEETGADTS